MSNVGIDIGVMKVRRELGGNDARMEDDRDKTLKTGK